MTVIGSGVALADDLTADGDGLVPKGSSYELDLGAVCAGSSVSKTINFEIERKTSGNNTYADGATVAVPAAPSSAESRLTVAAADSKIMTPAGWIGVASGTATGDPNVSMDGTAASTVTFAPGMTTNPLAANLTFTATGPRAGDNSALTRTATVRVTATVKPDCTAPTLNLPANISVTSTTPTPVTFVATADDANPLHPAVTCSPVSGSTFPLGTSTVTCDATDANNNRATGSFTVTVAPPADTTPPTLSLPANITQQATSPTGADVSFTATATDANPASPVVTCTPASGSRFPVGTTTVACSTKDAANNPSTGSFTVTITPYDVTAPVVTVPANVIAEATSANGAVVTYGAATALDDRDGALPASCLPASGATFERGTTTVTCSATDQAGLTGSQSFTVTVNDTTGPVLNLPADITTQAGSSAGAVVAYTATATDAVDGNVLIGCAPPTLSTFPLGTTTVECSAADLTGHGTTGRFTITVVDTAGPVISALSALQVSAVDGTGATTEYSPTATDLVDGPVPVTCNPASGSRFQLGTTLVTCTSTDARNNTSTSAFDVTVSDTDKPTLALPASFTAEATSAAGATVGYTATATDAVQGPITPSCSPAAGTTFALGATTVTCTATDNAGNIESGAFTVTVQDKTAPAVSVPDNVIAEATSPAGATVSFEDATALDTVDGALAATCAPVSGTTFKIGTTDIVCTAKDKAGNVGTGIFTATVRDTTDPVVTVPASFTTEATGLLTTVSYAASATDLGEPVTEFGCTPAGPFPLGKTMITCQAIDKSGHIGTGSFALTVQDTTAPQLTVPPDATSEATGPDGVPAAYGNATATDAVDPEPAVGCSPALGTVLPLGPNTITCTATDTTGNPISKSFMITVVDTTAPALTAQDDVTVEAAGPAGATADFTVTATDAVAGTPGVTCKPASGTVFALGDTPVSCTASDGPNTGERTFAVHVLDRIAPVLTVPTGVRVEATGPDGAEATFAVSATDAVAGSPPVSCSAASGSTFEVGDTMVRCTATDGKNEGNASFVVTVTDTTPPTVTVPDNQTVEATGKDGAPFGFTASAPHQVDGARPVDCGPHPPTGSTFPFGPTTVDCTATDARGISATASFVVTVRDTTAPVVVPPVGMTVEAIGPDGAPATFTATAQDVVDGDVAGNCEPASGSTFALGTTSVTCTATDAAGNSGTSTFTVTISDTKGPILTLPGNITREATGSAGADVSYSATASDIVDGPVIPNCVPPSGTFAVTTTTVGCSATDKARNTTQGSFTVTVQDTTPPVVSVPAAMTAEAADANGAVLVFTTSATDIVDGVRPVTCTPISGSTFAIGTTTVGCSAADQTGNPGSATFTVTVRDTTAPVLTAPKTLTAEATGSNGATVEFPATATDSVDPAPKVVCLPASGTVFALGETEVLCSATDAANNTTVSTVIVTVTDTTKPDLPRPADLRVAASGATGAVVGFDPKATDLVDGSVPVSCSPASGATFALGDSTVRCSATDAHRNTAETSFTVTVFDPTPPVIGSTLTPAEPDGTNGWYRGDVRLDWTVTEPESAATVAKAGCVDQNFTSDQAARTYACGATSAGGSTDPVLVTVMRDATPPTITALARTADGKDYAAGTFTNQTVTVTFTCDDGLSKVRSCPEPVLVGGDTAKMPVTGTAIDNAGNTTTTDPIEVKVDKTAPTISASAWTASGGVYTPGAFTNEAVIVKFSCADNLSGYQPCPADVMIDKDTLASGTDISRSVSDGAGNSATSNSINVKVDMTRPTISATASTATGPYTTGVFTDQTVTVHFTCSDGLAGLAGTPDCPVDAVISTDTPADGTIVVGTATDNAGNPATSDPITVKVDKTAPALAPSIVPNPVVLNGAATASANANDALTGVTSKSCAPVRTDVVGLQTVTCEATDGVGNRGVTTASYTVGYAAGGTCLDGPGHAVLQPVNVDGGSVFRQGSTVPVKFRVCDVSGASIGSAGVVTSFRQVAKSTAPGILVNEDAISTTADSAFRWDPSAQQWIFNLSTKSLVRDTAYTYEIALKDGSKITVRFGLK